MSCRTTVGRESVRRFSVISGLALGYPPGVRSFEELTDAGKARRLRVVAAAALERYDLRVRRLRLITNEFNAVFRVDAEEANLRPSREPSRTGARPPRSRRR